MSWTDEDAAIIAANLEAFGRSFTYLPIATGIGFPAVGILRQQQLNQSSSPGFFAHLDIDPLVIKPTRGDCVIWDDVLYAVVLPVNGTDGPTTIAIHLKNDP